ncbi:translesion DNA synthesis-associated protein ImuA [Paraburkholderia sp. SARCC-3016]|uniref:translesion DNA synthesis-associated protein ImuA n=1 Tax=Paraburkholderia sp. SARCC-3016 TaxID=3058611 RepID=UPI002806C256|nr:translesion DNA synthesis-associated protein ImuA [Paraburkholderia sp. SARCC-3016]MDQ7977741.1 translesion DNA synthesis-associated protein ImuA [Paraburkholderia sp. SARCC-3016]
MSPVAIPAEEIHPALWRASQLAHGRGKTVDTGYPVLSTELPGGGWPLGELVDLMVEQPGVGEMRLLRPALSLLNDRPIALIRPPHIPDGPGLNYIGLSLDRLLQIKATKITDALWSAEQMLQAGSCGAVLLWVQHVKASSLRRLHLAAQSSETLFIMVRPLTAAQDSSPAPLRLALRAAAEGLMVDIVKRRGPMRAQPLSISLQPTPVLYSRHARLSRRSFAEAAPRSLPAEVAA